jgi:2-amino-4-hydroxy-6-hydroxymethyldihydropteridine diphosphokinase
VEALHLAYIGLGANLGDREATLRDALRRVAATPDTAVTGVAPLRETEPVGFVEQPAFLNGAARLTTSLDPRGLLQRLLDIERELGRTREGPRYGPRVVDLDLLLYDDLQIDEPGLTVPHPRLHERRFVLEPLLDLDPCLEIPGRGSVGVLLARLD